MGKCIASARHVPHASVDSYSRHVLETSYFSAPLKLKLPHFFDLHISPTYTGGPCTVLHPP